MFLPKLTRAPLSDLLPGWASLGVSLVSLALLGCAPEATEIDEAGEGETQTQETETGGDEQPEPAEVPAQGIWILQVEANQGAGVPVAENGEWVAPSNRLAPLVRDRNTLIRVHYEVASDWVPRELEARLLLEFEDGRSKTMIKRRTVDGPSDPNYLDGTFSFGLAAEDGDVSPGMRFKVEIYELDEAAGAGQGEGVWQTPPQLELLGIQAEPMELEIVFVPYHHLYENIDRVADTSDANMKIITEALYEQNATVEVIWSVHEPVLWEQEMTNLGAVLGPTAALRDNEFAFPNVYYHALFPVLGGGVAGVAGVASVPGDGKGEGNSRVSVTALGSNVVGAAKVVVHEVGHNEGMYHVFCPYAAAASPDPTYPYQNGLLGQWGFGVLNFRLYSPTNTFDYMSYCGPSWVSTWSWTKTFFRIRTLTSWNYEGASDPGIGPLGYEERDLLIGSITNDGTEFWWTSHGTLPSGADPYGDEYAHQIELRSDGALVAALPSVVRYTNDYSTAWVISELPRELAKLEGVDAIVRVDDHDQRHLVAPATVQLSRR
jgi:hypothetical protein